MNEEQVNFHRQEGFWLKAATWTFGLWALMLPITGKLVIDSIKEVAEEQKTMAREFVLYREMNERRLAIIEERQSVVIQRLNSVDAHHKEEDKRR